MEQIYDVAVLGGGPGGYTAALYCARAGLSTVVLEKLSPGGQMATTSNVENYPGFAEGVDGFDLAMQMKDGAERFGVETLFADATAVALEGGVKTITTSSGERRARTVILATGADPRPLGVPHEDELRGRGVLCHLRRHAVPRQDGCCGGRRQLGGGGCTVPVPRVQKGVSGAPGRRAHRLQKLLDGAAKG